MALNAKKITHVCLDAGDTLWQNEPYFRRTEREFYALLKHRLTEREAEDKLFQTEMANLDTFGYGVKSFTLSMIQTALDVLPADEAAPAIRKILDLGKNLLSEPVVLLPGVKETLEKLAPNYHLAVITKGDLLAQERKLEESGLLPLFGRVEIVSKKDTAVYRSIFRAWNVNPENILMVGNSLKSDVLPAVEAGAQGVWIPCEDNWTHEETEEPENPPYTKLNALTDLLTVLL